MLITQIKPKDDVLALAKGKTVIISCEGCKEVYFPEHEAGEIQAELSAAGNLSAVVIRDYICNPDNLSLQIQKYKDKIDAADTVLVFSCGVGVQTASKVLEDKRVYAACDTYPLPGSQGVTPLEVDCDQCGECYLNYTGGICPITACSKSLLNGQCGGAKNGKCEVNKQMDCGWERIYKKLAQLNRLDILDYPTKLRDYSLDAKSGASK